MSWLDKILPSLQFSGSEKKAMPDGVWAQCPSCEATLYTAQLKREMMVCHKCGHHLRMGARERLVQFFDADTTQELAMDVTSHDHLKFKKYKDSLARAKKRSGETSALLVMEGQLKSMQVVAAAFEFSFIGGSMGSAVGERFVQGVHRAIELRCPFVCFCTSGGARMQEGLLSLMQMAKTSAALTRLAQHRLPYITVLADPTTGGVSASFAMLGDVIVAEPNALIGFAGPRVIEQTVRQTLPEGFQRSEFLLEKGAIDMIVPRQKLRDTIHALLKKLNHHHHAQH